MYQGKLQEYEGKLLSVKTIAGMVHLAPSTLYKYLNQGFTLYDAIEEGKRKSAVVFKNREKTNNQEAKKYLWRGRELTISQIALENGISKEPLYRRLKKGIPLEEAVLEIQENIACKYPFMGREVSLYRISLLTGIPRHYFQKVLNPSHIYQEEEIQKIINQYQKKDILKVNGISLAKYCIQNQLNYNVIYYLIKKYSLPVEEAISKYQREGQRMNFAYSFAIGDILLYHFLIKEKLDDRYVKEKMNRGESEIESIIACIFLSKETYKTRDIRLKLYQLYREKGKSAEETENLDELDRQFLRKKISQVEKVLLDYRLYEAINLLPTVSTDEERKYILQSLQLSVDDVVSNHDILFEDFIAVDRDDEISYVWKKRT